MKITGFEVYEMNVPLRTPFITAERRVDALSDIVLKLYTDTGDVGFGEAPPTKAITGETKESITACLLEKIRPVIMNRDISDFRDVLEALDHCVDGNTSAKACCDIALFDLYGKMKEQPVYALFGRARTRLETDLTISLREPEQMAQDAVTAVNRGFRILKIKVGIDWHKDIERLAAVRKAVGKDVRLRIDANQGWNARQAVEVLGEMQRQNIGLELVEQPVKKGDDEGLKYVTEHTDLPVVADESCFSVEDAHRIFAGHLADMVNIKLMKCGGLHQALLIAREAEKYGAFCMLGCMLEAKISVNAAVHLACAKACITAIDLDGPMLCREDPVVGGSVFRAPWIDVSNDAGLGIHDVSGLIRIG